INKADRLNKLLKIDVASGKSILITGGLFCLVTYITESLGTGAVIAGAFVIYRLATKIYRIIKMTDALDQHLESLARQAYQNT
ncbi:hypothetical protein N5I20_21965, partial [Aeromonas caviae]